MAMTNAQRQAAYRQRQHETCERLNIMLDASAKYALSRLARHNRSSQRAILEQLLVEADRATADKLTGKAQAKYYDGPVTQ